MPATRAAPTPAKAPAPAAPAPARASTVSAAPQLNLGTGAPIPTATRTRLESSFGANLSGVRVHTGSAAAATAGALNARAFAYGPQIVLGSGQRADDLSVMGHETAHVLQQQNVPAPPRRAINGAALPAVTLGSHALPVPQHTTSTLQRWTVGGSDRFESEANRAARAAVGGERFAVVERTSPRPQALFGIDIDIVGRALDWLADKANVIPGFRMFTIVLGVNPINMSTVERTPANVLRAIIEFIPGGTLITQALDNHGIIEKVGGWVGDQLKTLGLVGSSIKAAIMDFIDSLSVSDVFHLGDLWDRAKRIFTDPIDRIKNFVVGLVTGIIKFIKDAILMPLAKLAEGTRGWDLLCAVLGKNPITGEAVPRTAETLIPGFLKLIGQEEVWNNMKKANALSRAWAWFQSALSGLLGFVRQLPTLAINAFKALEIFDIILVPRAFIKVGRVFANFIGDFISWAGNAVWNLLEIIFDVVSPGAFGYVKKTGAALKSILKNPIPFVRNLVRAAVTGFKSFAGNFGKHLKAGLIDWLTGSLKGIYIPKSFDLGEIVKFAFSVLGLSWANVREKLVKLIGEPAVKVMEGAFPIVVTLVTKGPAAAWEQIKQELGNLKDTVISGIMDLVISAIVTKAIPKLIAMFIPGAGFISAILSIYDTVMVFVRKLAKIIEVVKGFIDSIVTIAAGNIGAASAKVESILAGLLTLAINFLAGFAGLGKIADKINGVLDKVRDKVDKGLNKLAEWIAASAKKLGSFFGGKDARSPEEKQKDLNTAVAAIRPQVEAMLSKGRAPGPIFRAKLAIWKLKYRLTALEITDGDLVATINPRLSVTKILTAHADTIRAATHAAGQEVLKLPEVRKAAAEIVKQREKGLGETPDKPIIIPPSGGLLGAAAAAQAAAKKPLEEPFTPISFEIPGASSPVMTLQTFSSSPSHTIVGPRRSPDPIGKYAQYAEHLKARGLTDADVRVGVALLLAGQKLPKKLAPHEAFLAQLTFLLGATETARITAQPASLAQALGDPKSGKLPQATVAAPVGAVAANKAANVQLDVPGAVGPSSTPKQATVDLVLKTQLERTEGFIIQKIATGELVFKNVAALESFLKKDLQGLVKEDILRAFGLMR